MILFFTTFIAVMTVMNFIALSFIHYELKGIRNDLRWKS